MKKSHEIYRDERYVLGEAEGVPYLRADGRTFRLTCHPYEPCLYIKDEAGRLTAVHNSFDPCAVLELFGEGRTVTSITGFEYGAKEFCRMVEYAAGSVDIQIDDAEKVFGPRAKKKEPASVRSREKQPALKDAPRPEQGKLIEDDPFFALIDQYPDSVVDFCLVKNEHTARGREAHRFALIWACRKLFIDGDGEVIWHYDAGRADAKQIGADALFAEEKENGALNYRGAFLRPPHTNGYTDADFEGINAALFPNGTDGLEVYEWTTDWSEYFDEGREWWGTLCLTVYDASLDRFVIIMASATD